MGWEMKPSTNFTEINNVRQRLIGEDIFPGSVFIAITQATKLGTANQDMLTSRRQGLVYSD